MSKVALYVRLWLPGVYVIISNTNFTQGFDCVSTPSKSPSLTEGGGASPLLASRPVTGVGACLQGYIAHKKAPPPRSLQEPCACGP